MVKRSTGRADPHGVHLPALFRRRRPGTRHAGRPRRVSGWIGLALVLSLLGGTLPVAAATDGAEAARQRREEVRQRRAAVAAQLDVLTADEAAVSAALDSLEANVAAAEAELVTATSAAEAAWARERRAEVAESRASAELADLQAQVRRLAVDAFISGDGDIADIARLMRAQDPGEAARASYLAGLEVERQDAVAARLAEVRAVQAAALVEAADASRQAASVVEEVTERFTALDQARALQAGFVAQVEAELERRLAEAAALEQLDHELAGEIRREEAALAARLAAERAARASAGAEAARQAGLRPVHLTGTEAPRGLPVGSGTLVQVGGFVVDSSIGESLAAMLAAAAADGLVFGGGGYRDAAAQLELRRAHCGPSDHELYQVPASSCRPPTARPGHSMHERGLALDLTLDGALITTRSNPGFVWLAAHAGRFGFRNLPSEPWHWSTTGG